MKYAVLLIIVLGLGCAKKADSYPHFQWRGSVADSAGKTSAASLDWPAPPGYSFTLPGKESATVSFVDSVKGQIVCQCAVALDGDTTTGIFHHDSCVDVSGNGFNCLALMGSVGKYEIVLSSLILQGGAQGTWSK